MIEKEKLKKILEKTFKQGLYSKIDINDFYGFDFLTLLLDKLTIESINDELVMYDELEYECDFYKIPVVETVDSFCTHCNKVTTHESLLDFGLISNSSLINFCNNNRYVNFVGKNSDILGVQPGNPHSEEKFERYITHIIESLESFGLFTRNFVCVHSKDETNKHFISYSFVVKDNYLIKTGQYPSVNDLINSKLKRYKKIDYDLFQELQLANGLFSHGVGIGSFVYLRRVIEKYIVNEKYKKHLQSQQSITYSEIDNRLKDKFADKINVLKDDLSELLHGNTKIYTILSSGIHELSNEVCLELFPVIFDSICIILDEEIERKEMAAKRKELAKKLNKL